MVHGALLVHLQCKCMTPGQEFCRSTDIAVCTILLKGNNITVPIRNGSKQPLPPKASTYIYCETNT